VEELSIGDAERHLRDAFDEGYRALAIVLMHAWRNPAHERALEALARRIGYPQISVSHRCSPAIQLIGRGDTTVADAYLSPVLRRYVEQVTRGLGKPGSGPSTERLRLFFMQSNGGLVESGISRARTAYSPAPPEDWLGRWRHRAARVSGTSSASTWAAPSPTWPTIRANWNAAWKARWRESACASRC
jgi:5-oxoprolinase (ATP-hydrolysing)